MGIYDNILAFLYLFAWIATFIWYHFKNTSWDGGTVVLASYVLYAIVAIFALNDESFDVNYKPLQIFPYIYLYLMLMIALSPAIIHHFSEVKIINEPNTRVLNILACIVIFAGILQIPDIVQNFGTGIIKLLTDTDAGKDAYAESMERVSDSGTAINNISSILFNSVFDISIFLFFYFLTLKKNIIMMCGLFLCILIGVLQPVIAGQRGPVIACLFTVIMAYMFFKQFMKKSIQKFMRYFGFVMLSIAMIPVIAITISRFGDEDKGGMKGTMTSYLVWYIGQGSLYFNNYGLDDNGIRYGDRTINLVKRLIDSDTPRNYIERRQKYHNLDIDDNLFTTFVGDFTIDFGPIVAVIIFVVFNLYVIRNVRIRAGTIHLHQMLLLYVTLCICVQGGMSLFSYSDTSNIKLLTFALFYAYLRYHDALLKRFPLEKKSV